MAIYFFFFLFYFKCYKYKSKIAESKHISDIVYEIPVPDDDDDDDLKQGWAIIFC